MTRKPRIALTPRITDNQFKQGNNTEYLEAILKAGGIPYTVALNTPLEEILADFDGLLVTGGEDLAPRLYHEEITCPIETSDFALDVFELEMIQAFAKAEKPILGICRGIQSINVAFQGTLYQDIQTQYPPMRKEGHQQHKFIPAAGRNDFAHEIRLIENTELKKLMRNETRVNSFHHQCVKEVAQGFTVNALSEDGLIEGIEREGILAVQWHPERLTMIPEHFAIFTWLIHRAKAQSEKI